MKSLSIAVVSLGTMATWSVPVTRILRHVGGASSSVAVYPGFQLRRDSMVVCDSSSSLFCGDSLTASASLLQLNAARSFRHSLFLNLNRFADEVASLQRFENWDRRGWRLRYLMSLLTPNLSALARFRLPFASPPALAEVFICFIKRPYSAEAKPMLFRTFGRGASSSPLAPVDRGAVSFHSDIEETGLFNVVRLRARLHGAS